MVIIDPKDIYKAKEIFAKYNSPVVYEEVSLRGRPLFCIKDGPISAILETFIELGLKEYKYLL